jgi:colanic acid biosynthesis protein WcaH
MAHDPIAAAFREDRFTTSAVSFGPDATDRDLFLRIVRRAPLISIDLIVRDPEGKFLVGWRRNEPARDTWFVPGGRIRKNESLSAAFIRLCWMELGLDLRSPGAAATVLKPPVFRGVYEHFYETNFAGEPGFGTHYIVLAYELRLRQPLRSLPPDQHDRYAWLTPNEILQHAEVHANTKAYFAA